MNKKYKFKFLQQDPKQDLGVFKWPKNEDIASVEEKYIFYGPINLIIVDRDNDIFQISRHDRVKIQKVYKELKETQYNQFI